MDATTRKPLDEASPAELRAFATSALGLEVGKTASRETLIAQIRTVYSGTEIRLYADPATPREAPARLRRERPMEKNPKRTEVAINIHRSDKPGAPDPIWAAVNGIGMWLPRGREIWVPEEYVEVLQHAEEFIYDEYDPDVDKGVGGLREPRRVQSYPFSFV